MSVQYLNMYKWENLNDGTLEKFEGRLDALLFELSLQTKLGCADITIPVYLPEKMYNLEMEQKYKLAQKNYKLRSDKLSKLIKLIKEKVFCETIVDGEYLYELWISKIFELNWRENKNMNDPANDLDILHEKLLNDSNINPYDIDVNYKKEINRGWKKILSYFKTSN